MPHKITNQELIEYAEKKSSPQQRTAIEAFLETNQDAMQFVRMYMMVSSITEKDDTVVASADAIQRAKQVWREKPHTKPSWLEKMDAFIAECIFDSRVQRASVRGPSGSQDFEFKTERFTVDVRLVQSQTSDDAPWVLTGQIDFADEKSSDACVSLRRSSGGEEVFQINVDDTGYFTMQGKQDELEVLIKVDEQWTHLQGISFT